MTSSIALPPRGLHHRELIRSIRLHHIRVKGSCTLTSPRSRAMHRPAFADRAAPSTRANVSRRSPPPATLTTKVASPMRPSSEDAHHETASPRKPRVSGVSRHGSVVVAPNHRLRRHRSRHHPERSLFPPVPSLALCRPGEGAAADCHPRRPRAVPRWCSRRFGDRRATRRDVVPRRPPKPASVGIDDVDLRLALADSPLKAIWPDACCAFASRGAAPGARAAMATPVAVKPTKSAARIGKHVLAAKTSISAPSDDHRMQDRLPHLTQQILKTQQLLKLARRDGPIT